MRGPQPRHARAPDQDGWHDRDVNVVGRLRQLLSPSPSPASHGTSLTTPSELTVYGADWCRDCVRAKRWLDAAGVAYRWVDLTNDLAAKQMLSAAGLRAIPVIMAPDGRTLVEPSNAELQGLVDPLS